MAGRSVAAYSVVVYVRGNRAKVQNLSQIGPDNLPLLKLFLGFVEAMREDPDRFRDAIARRYVPITRVAPNSQILIVAAEPGRYGLGGATRDAMTHIKRRDHEPGDSPGTPARVLLAQAPDATVGLLFVERVAGVSAGSDLMDGFTEAFKTKFPALNIDFLPIIEPSSWLATAALDKVQVIDRNFSRDVGSGETQTKILGTVEHILRPPSGVGRLAKKILDGLTDGTIAPEQVVNLADELVPDNDLPAGVEKVPTAGAKSSSDRTVKVRVVGEDGRPKTYVLGSPKTPAVAYDFDDGGTTPSDPAFRDLCVKLIPDLIGEQVEWKVEYHQEGTWPPETMTYRMELPPHGP